MAAGRVGSGIPPASELPTLPSPAIPRQLAKVKLSGEANMSAIFAPAHGPCHDLFDGDPKVIRVGNYSDSLAREQKRNLHGADITAFGWRRENFERIVWDLLFHGANYIHIIDRHIGRETARGLKRDGSTGSLKQA